MARFPPYTSAASPANSVNVNIIILQSMRKSKIRYMLALGLLLFYLFFFLISLTYTPPERNYTLEEIYEFKKPVMIKPPISKSNKKQDDRVATNNLVESFRRMQNLYLLNSMTGIPEEKIVPPPWLKHILDEDEQTQEYVFNKEQEQVLDSQRDLSLQFNVQDSISLNDPITDHHLQEINGDPLGEQMKDKEQISFSYPNQQDSIQDPINDNQPEEIMQLINCSEDIHSEHDGEPHLQEKFRDSVNIKLDPTGEFETDKQPPIDRSLNSAIVEDECLNQDVEIDNQAQTTSQDNDTTYSLIPSTLEFRTTNITIIDNLELQTENITMGNSLDIPIINKSEFPTTDITIVDNLTVLTEEGVCEELTDGTSSQIPLITLEDIKQLNSSQLVEQLDSVQEVTQQSVDQQQQFEEESTLSQLFEEQKSNKGEEFEEQLISYQQEEQYLGEEEYSYEVLYQEYLTYGQEVIWTLRAQIERLLALKVRIDEQNTGINQTNIEVNPVSTEKPTANKDEQNLKNFLKDGINISEEIQSSINHKETKPQASDTQEFNDTSQLIFYEDTQVDQIHLNETINDNATIQNDQAIQNSVSELVNSGKAQITIEDENQLNFFENLLLSLSLWQLNKQQVIPILVLIMELFLIHLSVLRILSGYEFIVGLIKSIRCRKRKQVLQVQQKPILIDEAMIQGKALKDEKKQLHLSLLKQMNHQVEGLNSSLVILYEQQKAFMIFLQQSQSNLSFQVKRYYDSILFDESQLPSEAAGSQTELIPKCKR